MDSVNAKVRDIQYMERGLIGLYKATKINFCKEVSQFIWESELFLNRISYPIFTYEYSPKEISNSLSSFWFTLQTEFLPKFNAVSISNNYKHLLSSIY